MWGTQIDPAPGRWVWRFIPTHVGNTFWQKTVPYPCAVYPHACGEHLSKVSRGEYPTGLSPRMWGTRRNGGKVSLNVRFIPTHVGNTYPGERLACEHAVYPHACGEHVLSRSITSGRAGLSPRMWGTPYFTKEHSMSIKFIPTHVGNTLK